MAKLGTAPEVISMALALKLDSQRPVEDIIAFCKSRINAWVKKAGGATSIRHVQEIVCRNLSLVLEEVWSDEDVDAVSNKYVAKRELVFASLGMQLDDRTFATVMRREHAAPDSPDRFVAVIDCRGRKAARRFFTRWHEIAHILTLVTQMQLPFQRFRSAPEGDPIERLMDIIAGEVGFYDPLFEPALAEELRHHSRLSFDGVERIRATVCPDASFQSTLIACAKRAPIPVIQLEAEMGYKNCEQAQLASRQLDIFPLPKPEAKLRAVRAVANVAASRRSLRIHPHMQIPTSSIIYKHYHESANTDTSPGASSIESLSSWRCSDGSTLGNGKIYVEARKLSGALFALVQPL